MKRFYKILILSVSIVGVFVLTHILNTDSSKLTESNLLDITKVNADSGEVTPVGGTAGDGDSSSGDGG
jgi:hypothetical protein